MSHRALEEAAHRHKLANENFLQKLFRKAVAALKTLKAVLIPLLLKAVSALATRVLSLLGRVSAFLSWAKNNIPEASILFLVVTMFFLAGVAVTSEKSNYALVVSDDNCWVTSDSPSNSESGLVVFDIGNSELNVRNARYIQFPKGASWEAPMETLTGSTDTSHCKAEPHLFPEEREAGGLDAGSVE